MIRLAGAIAMAMLCSPVWAQTANPARDCAGSASSSSATDCSKPENKQTEVKPQMPPTNLPNTVIPKSGATQQPDATPTQGVNK